MEETKTKKGAGRAFYMGVYCLGHGAYELFFEFYKNFQNFFFTEIAGMSTTLTASLITAINLCKVFMTPISGMCIDADPFKKAKDKYTPWIKLASLWHAVIFVVMAFIAWKVKNSTTIVAVIAFFFGLTPVFLFNGHRSAMTSIAISTEDSAWMASGVNLASSIGRMLTGVLVPFVMLWCSADGSGSDAQGFFWAVVVSVVLATVIYWACTIGLHKALRPDAVRSGAEAVKKQGLGLGKIIKQVFTSKEIMIVFLVCIGLNLRMFVVAPIAPYYFKYAVGNMLHYATYSTATNVAGILASVLFPFLMMIFKDTKKMCFFGMGLCLAMHLLLLVNGENMWFFITTQTVAHFAYQFGCVNALTMFTASCDFVELKERKKGVKAVATGTAMSLYFTSVMVSQLLGGIIRNAELSRIGYIGADTVATPEFVSGLVNLFVKTPCIFLVVAMIALCFFSIDKKSMDATHAELDVLRAADKEAE